MPGGGECLGSHEGGRASGVGEEGVLAVELVAYAKVSNLDVAIVPQQQVGGLDVSVDDLLVVYCKCRTHKHINQYK